jgi:hypothetical protein
VFSASLWAPYQKGSYEVNIQSNASITVNLELSLEFETYEKDELSILLPMETEIIIGKENQVDFSVLNSGQSSLNDIGVSITGIPDEWFDYSPRAFSSLESGESESINIIFTPVNPDTDKYTLLIEVESDKTRKAESLEVKLINETIKTETKEEKIYFPDLFTSNFISSTNDILNVISMIAAFMVLLVAILMKKHSHSPKKRTKMSNVIGNIREEVLKKETGKRKKRRKSAGR